MKRFASLCVALLLLSSSALHAADTLGIGDPAPKLQVEKFVKGEPVKEFKAGQVYVVEFWATWCGPCRAVMPHLSKLQKQYGDKVIMISVSVYEEDFSQVPAFVKEQGDKMAYRVAIDKVEKGGREGAGYMSKHWLDAAQQDGIPASFIVNGEGKVVWIGHPGQIDVPLSEVVAGTFDVAKAAAKYKKEKALQGKLQTLGAAIGKARQEGSAAVIKVLDEAIKESPELEEKIGSFKFKTMSNDKDAKEDDVLKYGQRLVDEVYKDDFNQLNALSWIFVDPARKGDKPSKAQLAFAVKAAEKGVEVSKGKSHEVLDTLACAYFAAGDKAKAIETIEKAIKLSDEPEYKERLEMFKK
jgi:thiol-disulfide isomerase/thioredoxin